MSGYERDDWQNEAVYKFVGSGASVQARRGKSIRSLSRIDAYKGRNEKAVNRTDAGYISGNVCFL